MKTKTCCIFPGSCRATFWPVPRNGPNGGANRSIIWAALSSPNSKSRPARAALTERVESSTSVQWHEGLGLYLVHARFHWNAKNWPENATYVLKGILPAMLPRSAPLPFVLAFAAPKKGQFPRAELTAPQTQVWVRSIRVARREDYQQEGPPNFSYEARITVFNRRIAKQSETRYAPKIFDATGKEPSFSGGYGLSGGRGHDRDITNPLIVGSGIEFFTYQIVLNQGALDSSPNWGVRQILAFNGRAPLAISFPIKCDGALLSGEIAPREWKLADARE